MGACCASCRGGEQRGFDAGIRRVFAEDARGVHGPHGTFAEAALATQPDLSQCMPVPLISVPEVPSALDDGAVDHGFVPVEKAIDGTVNVT